MSGVILDPATNRATDRTDVFYDMAPALRDMEDEAPTVPMQAVNRQVGVGAMWSALNASVLRVSTFVVSLIVAHIVSPHDFGVFTVAITVFNIVVSVCELGVASAVIRQHDRSREIAPTVFTISLVNGAFLALLMVVFASPIARALGAGNAAASVRVLSLIVLMSGFTIVPLSLMTRDFMQRERFITDAAFFVCSTVVMLVLVLSGHPVMGLAVSRVAGQLATTVLILCLSPERYWPGFRWQEAKQLLAFGLPLTGANLLTLAITNVDFIVVGSTRGATPLGYYQLAFNISTWPVTIFSSVMIAVTLPTLSRVRDSPAELMRHLQAGLSAVASVSFPVYFLLATLAGPVIDTVYGTRWHPAWEALVVLSIFGAFRVVLQLFTDLTVALGLTKRLLLVQVIWMVTLTPAMIFCVRRWGIAGAGIAHVSVVLFVVIPLYLIMVRRGTGLQLGWIGSATIRPLLAAAVAGGAALGSTWLVHGHVVQVLVGIPVGTVVYLLVAGSWLSELQRRLRTMYWHAPRRPRHAAPGRARRSRRTRAQTLL